MNPDELTLLEYIETLLLSDATLGAQVILDLESEFSVVDANGVSTPVLFVECDSTEPTGQENNLGTIIFGETSMSITGIVAKENRPFKVYKREAVDLRNKILTLFRNTGRKVAVRKCSWNSFMTKGIKTIGFVLDIETSTTIINN